MSFVLLFFKLHIIIGTYLQLDFLIYFILMLGILYFCFDVNLKEVIFYGMASYTVQHLNDNFANIIYMIIGLENDMSLTLICFLMSFVVYTLFYFVLVRRIKKYEQINISPQVLIITMIFTIFIVYLLSMLNLIYVGHADYFHYIYASSSCILLLFLQFGLFQQGKLANENETMEQLLYKDSIYRKASAENIKMINIKCHDLKYQINMLRQSGDTEEKKEIIDELERSVYFFDANLKTGCKTLDILLMEKSIVGEKNKIHLACMIDGKQLNFMNPTDIYTLFANALDNAIESVSKIEDIEKRIITINVKRKAQMVFIHIENIFEGQLRFKNNLPVTSKKDSKWHGFGVKSIQYIVKKYHGTMTIKIDKSIYNLNISFFQGAS